MTSIKRSITIGNFLYGSGLPGARDSAAFAANLR